MFQKPKLLVADNDSMSLEKESIFLDKASESKSDHSVSSGNEPSTDNIGLKSEDNRAMSQAIEPIASDNEALSQDDRAMFLHFVLLLDSEPSYTQQTTAPYNIKQITDKQKNAPAMFPTRRRL